MLMKVPRPPVRISPHISRICLSTFCWSSNSPCDETTIILCAGVTNASHNCCYCNSAQWAPSETRTFELFVVCQGCWLIKHRRGGETGKQTYQKVMKDMKKHCFLVQEVDKGDAKGSSKPQSFGDAPEDKQWQEHTATPWRRVEIEFHVGSQKTNESFPDFLEETRNLRQLLAVLCKLKFIKSTCLTKKPYKYPHHSYSAPRLPTFDERRGQRMLAGKHL